MPDPIRFSEREMHAEELPYMVQVRFLQLKGMVYQPFLHYAIHNPPSARYQAEVRSMAEKALSTSLLFLRDERIDHRHHGSWLHLRTLTASALAVIACARSPSINLPSDWKQEVSTAIERMRYWEAEAPGLSRALEVIETLLHDSG